MNSLLPDKPSDLLDLALDDLQIVRLKPGYVIDMPTGHYYHQGTCYVGLEGCVWANSLGLAPTVDPTYVSPPIDSDTNNKLIALMYFAQGRLGRALERMGREMPDGIELRPDIPDYDADPEAFIAALRAVAEQLRSAGY